MVRRAAHPLSVTAGDERTVRRRQGTTSLEQRRAVPVARPRPRANGTTAPCSLRGPSLCVMEDDADRVAVAASNSAHTMAQVDAVDAARSLHGPAVHGEDHRVALHERHHFRA